MNQESPNTVENDDTHPDNHPGLFVAQPIFEPTDADKLLKQYVENLVQSGAPVPEINGIPPEQLIEMYAPKNTPNDSEKKDPTP